EDVEILWRMQGIDAEIKCARRKTILSRGLVENFRRNRVINAAGPNKQGIELVFVLGEKLQFGGDALRNRGRQQSVKEGARRDQSDKSHRNIEGSAEHELVSFFCQRATCLSGPSFPDSVWERICARNSVSLPE